MDKTQQLEIAVTLAIQQRNAAHDQILNLGVQLEIANRRIKELEVQEATPQKKQSNKD